MFSTISQSKQYQSQSWNYSTQTVFKFSPDILTEDLSHTLTDCKGDNINDVAFKYIDCYMELVPALHL